MKIRNFVSAVSILFLTLVVISACKEDEGFTQVTEFEGKIQSAIDNYRASKGKSIQVQTFLLIDDAQSYSSKMASESVAFGTEALTADLENLKVLVGADSAAAWVAYCQYEEADSVMNIVKNDPKINTLVLGNFNLSAIGAVKDNIGNFYITNILLHKSEANE
jgi:hypothetical protein